MKESVIVDKSKAFALRIIKLYRYLCAEKQEYVLSKQLLRSGTSIGDCAFYGCSSLTSIDIPGSVTSIGGSAFRNCSSLTSVTIPDGVTSIGESAFSICSSLTSIFFESATTEIYDSPYTISNTATIYGYEGSTAEAYAEKYNREFVEFCDGNQVYGDWQKLDDDKHIRYCTKFNLDTMAICSETADHVWNDGVITAQPTCATNGVKTFTCTECEATYTESVPATGEHTYGKWQKHNSDKHIRYCTGTDCDSSETADHVWNDGIVTTDPTCAKEGVKTFTCADCEATYTEPVPATGEHIYGDWEQYDEPNHIRHCTGSDCEAFETESHEYSGAFDMNCNICDHEKATSGDFGENMSWQVTEDGVLSIGGTGDVDISEDAPWSEYLDGITSVTVSENVSSIDADMFEGMTNLTILMILSNDVIIEDSASAIPSHVVIYGYAGSTAELYASKYGREFVNMSITAGDINDDDTVDKNDAIYLLYSVLFGDSQYPLNQTCDFNADGTTDKNDAIYLLYHALFGAASYPLN